MTEAAAYPAALGRCSRCFSGRSALAPPRRRRARGDPRSRRSRGRSSPRSGSCSSSPRSRRRRASGAGRARGRVRGGRRRRGRAPRRRGGPARQLRAGDGGGCDLLAGRAPLGARARERDRGRARDRPARPRHRLGPCRARASPAAPERLAFAAVVASATLCSRSRAAPSSSASVSGSRSRIATSSTRRRCSSSRRRALSTIVHASWACSGSGALFVLTVGLEEFEPVFGVNVDSPASSTHEALARFGNNVGIAPAELLAIAAGLVVAVLFFALAACTSRRWPRSCCGGRSRLRSRSLRTRGIASRELRPERPTLAAAAAGELSWIDVAVPRRLRRRWFRTRSARSGSRAPAPGGTSSSGTRASTGVHARWLLHLHAPAVPDAAA